MHDEHPHPFLAQIPLTVSPFLHLPTPIPLPYTYKSLPSTLPPSILSSPSSNPTSSPSDPQQSQQQHQPAYILSSSGQTAASPDTILASCHALQAHLQKLETDARETLRKWEEKRKAEELAEKRRVAPGWLDGDVKLLVPENVGPEGKEEVKQEEGVRRKEKTGKEMKREGEGDERVGEELDRAFGGLGI
ncbi:hypothetical protein M011DRAFT_495927 [Sporormia fimetaria CBS 119925]|uniref:Uncharacterized protein n=1 Tax=Sporormia fimetaria CBS 119925 TaxID=1340428 RepID=A0A6A6V6H7_9PLEO|nr:hypothetical protein M011DRAFT_495927 [Sporormia fimetaria CBS 119925]